MAPPPCKPPARASADAPPPTVMRRFVLANQELARHNTKVRPSRPLNTSRLLKHSCVFKTCLTTLPPPLGPAVARRALRRAAPRRHREPREETGAHRHRSVPRAVRRGGAREARPPGATRRRERRTRDFRAAVYKAPSRRPFALSRALSPDPPPRSPRRRASEPPPRRSRSSRSSSTRRLACSAFSARWRPHPRRRPRARARRSNPSRPPEPPPPPPRGHSAFPIARRLRPSPGGSLRRR